MADSAEPPRARTKIVATIGPACCQAAQLEALVLAGADVFRLNMAHGTRAEHQCAIDSIRSVSRRLARPIATLVDLAGPKIRLGELEGGELVLAAGQEVTLVRSREPRGPLELTTTYEPLVDELDVGSRIMLADGAVSLSVREKGKDFALCAVSQPGTVRSRQGLNLPGVNLSAPAISDVDRDAALWASGVGIDFIGLSFVRAAADVRELKSILRSERSVSRVVAKIEKQEAIDDLDRIVEAADAVMVARGDLGVEIDVAQMPVVQKHIVSTCDRQQKPVIIATQMLDSMQNSPRPSRAEVTDVANAILDGGDACMLSGETAVGKYPREAVEMMNRVALATEELFRDRPPLGNQDLLEGLHPVTAAVTYGAGHVAAKLDARMIVVASHTGATALALSKQRSYVPTLGVSDSPATLRQMCLFWGVIPLEGAPIASTPELMDYVSRWGREHGRLKTGDYVVLVAGTGLTAGSHNMVVVHQVA